MRLMNTHYQHEWGRCSFVGLQKVGLFLSFLPFLRKRRSFATSWYPCVYVSLYPFQLLNQFTDFHESLCEIYVIGNHPRTKLLISYYQLWKHGGYANVWDVNDTSAIEYRILKGGTYGNSYVTKFAVFCTKYSMGDSKGGPEVLVYSLWMWFETLYLISNYTYMDKFLFLQIFMHKYFDNKELYLITCARLTLITFDFCA